MDKHGYVQLEQLVANTKLTITQVLNAVDKDSKQRYLVKDGAIKAQQGHSIPVELELEESVPPEILFHGTTTKAIASIRQNGLQACTRNHVHLSEDLETATTVGARHGKPTVLRIKALAAFNSGQKFYKTGNNVWLTSHILPGFIENE
jgi:putative RNA 2'-phosphotransferase